MRIASISHSYAKVLFSLAKDAGELNVVLKDIKALGLLCKKMHQIFTLIDKQATIGTKAEFLNTIMSYGKFSGSTKKFLELLKSENEIALLFDISQSFMGLYRKDQNVVLVKVKSVEKIGKDTETKLMEMLKDSLKKEIEIDNVVDQSIMGGIIIEIGSYVIDSSFLNKLRRIKLAVDEV